MYSNKKYTRVVNEISVCRSRVHCTPAVTEYYNGTVLHVRLNTSNCQISVCNIGTLATFNRKKKYATYAEILYNTESYIRIFI